MKSDPILITGHHRSGTTWIGKVIYKITTVEYLHEPLNLRKRTGFFDFDPKYYYYYPTDPEFFEAFERLLTFKFNYWSKIKSLSGWTDVKVGLVNWNKFRLARSHDRRPLVKDPFCLFAAPLLYEQFEFDIVYTIRHPAAFINSISSLGWDFDFSNLYEQEHLINDILPEFEDEIYEATRSDLSILETGILLWKIFYHHYTQCQEDFDWYFTTHETLVEETVSEFGNIFDFLDLPFTTELETAIIDMTRGSQEVTHHHDVWRDSKYAMNKWKTELTQDQQSRIEDELYPISKSLYPSDYW